VTGGAAADDRQARHDFIRFDGFLRLSSVFLLSCTEER
jgi:hypothetical protein